jgi:hypothetical protein
VRIIIHVIGMLVFGALALLVPAWLYDARVSRPAPAALEPAPVTTGTSGRTAAVTGGRDALFSAALDGMRGNLDVFADAIQDGRRSDAAHALDAAYHLATVIRSATDGAATSLYERVIAARRALQNGDPSRAAAEATSAASLAARVRGGSAQPPADLSAYEGAVLLGPDGSVLGRVASVSADALTVEVGGSQWLGFIPNHGTASVQVPASAALFGPHSAVRGRMVVANLR